ncbi:hypothetical protein MASR2M64_17070 [Candidatus Cloacimonadota bacterium]
MTALEKFQSERSRINQAISDAYWQSFYRIIKFAETVIKGMPKIAICSFQ